jgi:hypothetical protein
MKNTYEYRYFLFINYLANQMIGMEFQNFAELIKSENEGRYMNSQMTSNFYKLDEVFSELIQNDPEWVFDFLDLDELAEISPDTLEDDYIAYCVDEEEFIQFRV